MSRWTLLELAGALGVTSMVMLWIVDHPVANPERNLPNLYLTGIYHCTTVQMIHAAALLGLYTASRDETGKGGGLGRVGNRMALGSIMFTMGTTIRVHGGYRHRHFFGIGTICKCLGSFFLMKSWHALGEYGEK